MGCLWLTVAGAAAEAFGFGLLAWQLARVQGREFGRPEFIRRAEARVRRWLGGPKHQTIHVEGIASMSAVGNMTVRGGLAPDATVEERVEHLERQHDELRTDLDAAREELATRAAGLGKEVAQVEGTVRELEASRRTDLRESVRVQAWGTAFFLVGLLLSVLGNALTC